ncbi:MAG TPA: phasin family protein [Stellaceae bacterium]|nr:phasin family protein [Stellaceae bacterium]
MATKVKKPATAEAAASEFDGAAAAAPAGVFAGCEELADLGREIFAAVLRANAAFTEGIEAIGKEMMGYARSSLENAAEAATALLAAKTFEDLVQVNSDFAKASFERMVERSTKLSEMGVKVANEALAPLGDRVEATFQKLGKPLAA